MVKDTLLPLSFLFFLIFNTLNMLLSCLVEMLLLRIDCRRVGCFLKELIGVLVQVHVLSLIIEHFAEAFEVILQLELPLRVIQHLILTLSPKVANHDLARTRWLTDHHSP